MQDKLSFPDLPRAEQPSLEETVSSAETKGIWPEIALEQEISLVLSVEYVEIQGTKTVTVC